MLGVARNFTGRLWQSDGPQAELWPPWLVLSCYGGPLPKCCGSPEQRDTDQGTGRGTDSVGLLM